MRAKAKILAVNKNLAKIEIISDTFRVKPGEYISLRKGSQRSLQQNAFLWVYYTYLLEHGLQDYGFYCVGAIHFSLKQKFLAEKELTKGEWKALEEATTTTLSKSEFSSYLEKIDCFVNEFFKINTAPFFEEYEQVYKPDWR